MLTKDELKKKYLDWLHEEITITEFGQTFEITSPFLDRFNDYLQIYATPAENDQMLLSDDAYIINNLIASGIDITTQRRKEILNTIIRKYGIERIDNQLTIKCTATDFGKKKHLLAQAMLNIDDMFMLSQNRIASLFLEDILAFFKEKEIYYMENVNFIGRTGYTYNYDFVMQRSKNRPERLCKAINNVNKSNVENVLFSWNDTKETRDDDTQLIIFINDRNNVDDSAVNALKNYDAKIIKWSEINKESNLQLLSS